MNNPVERLTSALSDRYTIESELGQGGMATVYLAHDVRHDRKVAVKVLRPELAAVIGGERFLHEIKVTANLQHPHILTLHESGEADSFLYYVMPYVEGESLREKLEREKQLSVEAAIEITRAVASALDYAHRHDVIHRDIKPENILLEDGQPVVADFGIALAVTAAGGARLTETGLSLGTPHYMSPEQATADRELDARSDVYSLACVTYEMLTGEPPFTAPSAQAVVAKILTEVPGQITLHRRTVQPHIESAVHKALEKLPADRFATGAEFAAALVNPTAAVAKSMGTGVAARSATAALPARFPLLTDWRFSVAMIVAVVAALGAASWGWMRSVTAEPITRFVIALSETERLAPVLSRRLALSPDGRLLVYAGVQEGTSQLYVRPVDQLDPRPLPGTEGAYQPFFSPDGQWVGFVADGKLKKVALGGGPPITITESVSLGIGAGWDPSGVILFSSSGTGLLRVPAAGGVPEPISTPDTAQRQIDHRHVDILPGGEAALVTLWNGIADDARVGLVSLESGTVTPLLPGTSPRYISTGHLVYANPAGTLMAAPFDVRQLELTGPSVSILEDVRTGTGGTTDYALSDKGRLVYLRGAATNRGLVIVDREGTVTPVTDERREFTVPRFSPDGQRVAVTVGRLPAGDIWVYDVNAKTSAPLTFDGNTLYSEWEPGGQRLVFASNRQGTWDLFGRRADGTGRAEPVFVGPEDQYTGSWSRDGRHLTWRQSPAPGAGGDIMVLTLETDSAWTFLGTGFEERTPKISPDGRWMAYTSNETGATEVWVRTFPDPDGGRWQVSLAGGAEPAWAHDGRELYYRSALGIVVVTVGAENVFTQGGQEVLFEPGFEPWALNTNYDVHPDGEHFVMITSAEEDTELIVVSNWFQELRRRTALNAGN